MCNRLGPSSLNYLHWIQRRDAPSFGLKPFLQAKEFTLPLKKHILGAQWWERGPQWAAPSGIIYSPSLCFLFQKSQKISGGMVGWLWYTGILTQRNKDFKHGCSQEPKAHGFNKIRKHTPKLTLKYWGFLPTTLPSKCINIVKCRSADTIDSIFGPPSCSPR